MARIPPGSIDAAPRIVTAGDDDRAREFRRAYRHSRVVRVLRWLTPVAAVALFASYGLAMRVSLSDGRGGKLTGLVDRITTENLQMSNPEYQGFNKDGSRFVVRAASAQQDLRQKNGPITLRDIDARMLGADDVLTRVTSPRGIYQNETSVLELFERVSVRQQSGLTATMTRATLKTKEGLVTSPEPVLVEMAAGWVHGNQMALDQRLKRVAFTGGVTAQLTPTPANEIGKRADEVGGLPVKPQSDRTPGTTAAGPRLFAASNAPVDVTSERLDIDDEKKRAVFKGQVTAVQGEASLRASELEIEYAGEPQSAAVTAPNKAPGAGASASPAQGQVKTITARQNVLLTRGLETAQAPLGVFDATTETATLTGGVLLRQGAERQATADRADIDSKGETSKLSGNVVLTSGTTQRASADVLELDQKGDTALLTGQQVIVTQGPNSLAGRRLMVNRKAGSTEMTAPGGRITASVVREQTAPGAAGQPKARTDTPATPPAGQSVGGLSFKGDPNAPVDIEAERMLALDSKKTATFTGDVVAVQGDFKLKTPELVATYSGEMSMLRDPNAPPVAKPRIGKDTARETPKDQPQAQLTRIRANRKVVLSSTREDQEVMGDWADFDVKTNLITIGVDKPEVSNVTVRQGATKLYGPKIVVDLSTGAVQWDGAVKPTTTAAVPQAPVIPLSPAAAVPAPGTATQAITQRAIQAIQSQQCGGKPCAIFAVRELRDKAAKKDPQAAAEIEAAARSAGAVAKKAIDGQGPELKALIQKRSAAGWSATTTAPDQPRSDVTKP